MGCVKPLDAWVSNFEKPNGKRYISFNSNNAYILDSKGMARYSHTKLPCGRCIGCRLERSRQWAIRCVHEASMYENNCFLTLTYKPESLPENGSLNKRHFQLFMKKLRKKYPNDSIRYLHCGEYGSNTARPHYHALIFNFDFPDKVYHKTNKGNKLYTSEILDETWSHGLCWIGEVTFESAAYTCRYITKKLNYGRDEENHNKYIEKYGVDKETGEILKAEEYITMSRRKGIGRDWLEKYTGDVYPQDEVFLRGKRLKPPKYYDEIYDIIDHEEMIKIKEKRKMLAEKLTKGRKDYTYKAIERRLLNNLKNYGRRPYEEETIYSNGHKS